MRNDRNAYLMRQEKNRMQRRIFMLTSAIALAGATASAWAQDYAASILAQLRDLGFQQIELQRTLLGRTRILATNAEGQREIILNPNSGEILRDLWTPANGSGSTARLVDNSGKAAGNDNGSDGSESGGGSGDNGPGSDGGSGSGSDDDGESGSGGGGDNSGSGGNSGHGGGSGGDDDDDRGGGSDGGDDGGDDHD